jgi:hypothetical protein
MLNEGCARRWWRRRRSRWATTCRRWTWSMSRRDGLLCSHLHSCPQMPRSISPPLFLFLSRVLAHSPTTFPLTFHCWFFLYSNQPWVPCLPQLPPPLPANAIPIAAATPASQTFALRVIELEEYRRRLREYLNARMHSVRRECGAGWLTDRRADRETDRRTVEESALTYACAGFGEEGSPDSAEIAEYEPAEGRRYKGGYGRGIAPYLGRQ